MRYERIFLVTAAVFAMIFVGTFGEGEENRMIVEKDGKRYVIKRKQGPLHPGRKIRLKKQGSRVETNVTDSSDSQTSQRDGRFLSLFTVVNFRNQGCAASSGDNGTCLTAAECKDRGGVASGPCANGFGVCCVFLATCGQSTRENCTYFVNTNFPQAFDGTDSCQLTIHKAHPNICQYRLDFDQFNIAGPEPINNICNNDQFIVSGGNPVPGICGYNNGNHMYIDAGNGITSPVTLTFVTSGPSFSRTWKVKVCQIPCDSLTKAEDGCLQYFTGVSGQIRSYNYDAAGGLQLSNQDYSICIRSERNFCGIQYSACSDPVNNQSRAFTLSGNTLGQNPVTSVVGSAGTQPCNSDWLIIPCASNVDRVRDGPYICVDRICGGTFNSETSLTPAAVYSTVRPFRLIYHTNGVEYPTDVANRGFCLNYVQQPCTNVLNRSRWKVSSDGSIVSGSGFRSWGRK